MDLEDPTDVRLLLKKLWCHGQLVAPLQGAAYAWWAIEASSSEILDSERVLLWISAGVLPFWSYVSWRQMHSSSAHAASIILSFGLFMELLHTAVVVLAAHNLSSAMNLIVFIITLLHVIETAAYLLMIACYRWVLEADPTPEVDQKTLLGIAGMI